jgi:DMSO reductase anchor subunit
MTRTDSIPLRYERDEQGQGSFKTKVRETGKKKGWNLGKLRSREDPLVVFTLISQGVVGALITMFLASLFGPSIGLEELSLAANPVAYLVWLFILLGLETFALVLSTMHLGKPHRFYRAFNNLRYSPVSREVAGIAVFYNMLGAYALLAAFPGLFTWLPEAFVVGLQNLFGWGAVISGPVALYFMHAIYRIKARPFWNHWQVLSSFYGNMLTLGSLITGMVFAGILLSQGKSITGLMQVLSYPVLSGLMLEAIGLIFHARDLKRQGGEGAASHYEQCTTFGKTYISRNIGLLMSITAVAALSIFSLDGIIGYTGWIVTTLVVVATALVGRALFYVLVIPTTMPGAFFWRNKGFQEHARETGLANMPQVGVVPDAH